MTKKTFIFHSDAGHGWLAVKVKYLIELGIVEKISYFSYYKGQTVYLEEDLDAGIFIQAYVSKFGEKPKIKSGLNVNYSPIRSYKKFNFNEFLSC